MDDGSGRAVGNVYVNGGQVAALSLDAPSPADPTFQNRGIRFLPGTVGAEVERFAVWRAFSPDGTEPQTDLFGDLSGTAAYWNGEGLPAGWSKIGTGLWEDM